MKCNENDDSIKCLQREINLAAKSELFLSTDCENFKMHYQIETLNERNGESNAMIF